MVLSRSSDIDRALIDKLLCRHSITNQPAPRKMLLSFPLCLTHTHTYLPHPKHPITPAQPLTYAISQGKQHPPCIRIPPSQPSQPHNPHLSTPSAALRTHHVAQTQRLEPPHPSPEEHLESRILHPVQHVRRHRCRRRVSFTEDEQRGAAPRCEDGERRSGSWWDRWPAFRRDWR